MPLRITVIGIKIRVFQKPGSARRKLRVTVAPTATPKIVRIASLKIFIEYKLMPISAASKQLNSGPNNHGSGSSNHKKIAAPVRHIV
jgi:hypothetical protein